MRIVGFVEGARWQSGGVGLVGVPMIHQSLAARGHEDILIVGGKMMPSGARFELPTLMEAFSSPGHSRARSVSCRAAGRWAFAPSMFAANRYIKSCDFVTLHSLYSFPVLAGQLLALNNHKPYGLWPHGVLAPVQRRIGRRRKAIYDRLVAQRIMRRASVLFFSAEGEREESRSVGLDVPSVVIPHGIDVGPFSNLPARGAFRAKHLQGHVGPLVLYLGRLNEKKGLDLLIDAMSKVVAVRPGAKLAIAGGAHPPSFQQNVARWLAASPVRTGIVLTGLVDEAEKLEAFADADVFVLPSEAENFGFAIFEAMASRLPVVVSDTLNYAATIRSCQAGLTPPRTRDAFAAAIDAVLGDSDKAREMGFNGAALAAEYSWERCGQRIETAIECLITARRIPAELSPEYPR